MSRSYTRRSFLKLAAAGSLGAVAGISCARHRPAIVSAGSLARPEKLRVAVIGCGGQGVAMHVPAAMSQHLVALVDPDRKCIDRALEAAVKRSAQTEEAFDPSKVRTFSDYRQMFDTMHRGIDAILVATPNHQHALPAMIAMKLGIGCYVEKPLTYDIHEARTLAEWSRRYKVATQMGNQGHSQEGYRRLCEYIWAGALGQVREVYCWTDRSNGGVGGRLPTLPVPEGMNWDSWIGPAPYRDYHAELHPHTWHSWHDFGGGSLGNMGCHVMDGAHWALKLGHPTSVEVEQMIGGSEERYPRGTRIRWDFPEREGMPPVRIWWYDGIKEGAGEGGQGEYADSVAKPQRNRPPLVEELEKKYGRNLGGSGSIYVGEKGVMFTADYGNGVRILPEEAHRIYPPPPPSIPRIRGTHHDDFFNACRTGQLACSNFETASKLTEVVLLGCLAMKAGEGRKIEWDGQRCTNIPELNRYLQREYREGWRA